MKRCAPKWPPNAAPFNISTLFGFINSFKPPGPSSAAFGNWVKHVCDCGAVGHWGTLDPTACGVLVLAVGKATKLLPMLPHARKQYVFELVVGERTDSGDATGAIIERSRVGENWADDLNDAASSLIGTLDLIPPMHSAVKVDGEPLYRLARKGRTVPRAPRPTTIHNLRVLSHEKKIARLFIECDAGTYVRAVCEEIGRRLGLPARMGALLRVASGPFVLRDSVRPERIASDVATCLIDPLAVLPQARLELDDPSARRFRHGNEVQVPNQDGQVSSTEVLVTQNGSLIGSGNLFQRDSEPARIAPTRVFADP